MKRVFNFGAGPATLPEEVLQQAQEEMLDWHNTGMSVMEVSHRSKAFMSVVEQSEADLRELLNIPKNYHVLFLTGGATAQFAMIPLNLLNGKKEVDYINSGEWGKKAIAEAKRFATVNVVTTAETKPHFRIPPQNEWKLNPNAAYFHFTSNETIEGIEFNDLPKTNNVPLVADMSSNILSRPLSISDYGLIYAGAQKNIGQSGITIVIVRDDLVGHVAPNTPSLYDYKIHVDNKSLYNTPPTYSWYIAGLIFSWLKRQGGLKGIAEKNQRKANKLYQYLDNQDFYKNTVVSEYRSRMNVPFILKNAELDAVFLKEAEAAGLTNLQGHRNVGGMRASIYNAMPEAGIDALISFMQEFVRNHG